MDTWHEDHDTYLDNLQDPPEDLEWLNMLRDRAQYTIEVMSAMDERQIILATVAPHWFLLMLPNYQIPQYSVSHETKELIEIGRTRQMILDLLAEFPTIREIEVYCRHLIVLEELRQEYLWARFPMPIIWQNRIQDEKQCKRK